MRRVQPTDIKRLAAWKGKPREGTVIRDYILDRGVVTDRRSGKSVPAGRVLDGDLECTRQYSVQEKKDG